MSATSNLITLPRPVHRSAVAVLSALGEIGATGVLVHSRQSSRLDFQVPTERMHRAAVLIGDRAEWAMSFWENIVALAVLLTPGGLATLDSVNDETHVVDLSSFAAPREPMCATILQHRLAPADVGTPAALFRALRAIGGDVVLRRDRQGLGLGFAAPASREVRLDLLLSACAGHDGDFWIDAVAEVGRLFPAKCSPWAMRPGDVRRLRLAEAAEVSP